MLSAHCIQALKPLVRLVGRYPPAKFISRIVAWVRNLRRWVFASDGLAGCATRSSMLSGGTPGYHGSSPMSCAPQVTLPHDHDHTEPSVLAHDIIDRDEAQPGEQTPSREAAETVNTQNPSSPPGPTPTTSPSSFPSYPSSALSPTAPELLVQRYHRGGTITKTDVKVTLEPHTRSFTRDDPPGWAGHVHPEGALYYAHDSMNIFTDCPMHEKSTFEIVMKFIHAIQEFRSANGILPDPKVDLVLEVTIDDSEQGPSTCGYYLADHDKRTIFWYHSFAMERLPRCYEVYGPRSSNHIQIELTAQYWFHCSQFSDNLPVTPELVCELRDTVLYNITDSLDSQTTTLPHSVDDLMKMLTVIESLKGNLSIFDSVNCAEYHKFYNFHGETFARLDRRTSVFGHVSARSILLRILTPILFNAPSSHLRTLEEVYVDEVLNLSSWCRVVDTLSLEWQEHILFATVLMNAGIAFLAIPTVDNGQNTFTRSTGQIAGYISVIASLGSVIVGLILLHKNRTRKTDLDAMASFLGSHFHAYFGLETLALLYSLPFALLMWGTIAFLIAFLVMCLQSSDASARALVACSTAVVMFGVLWCFQPGQISVLQRIPRGLGALWIWNRVSPIIGAV
ncbi:hypothetical protein GGX14DRAFT_501350 [Mycena pura]|uniref:Uncharacterized protein n=1 Tax=Mycena pura TaxID=153505 RepID=A0AAD6V6C5_9AGAR|nr:hypothetical protein GGX14DRAFT_501350 [Mycena pura]